MSGSVTPMFSSCAMMSTTEVFGWKSQRSNARKELRGTGERSDALMCWTVMVKRRMRSSGLTYGRTQQCRWANESDAAACSRRAAVAWRSVMFGCTSSGQTTGMML